MREPVINLNDTAVRYLKRQGYKILEQNRNGLVNAVAKDGESVVLLHFFDGSKECQAITRDDMERACAEYLAESKTDDCHLRFDVVRVTVLDYGKGLIRHYKDTMPMAASAIDLLDELKESGDITEHAYQELLGKLKTL